MTTFDDDEQSIEASQPREGFEIVYGTTTYRLASGSRDIIINGNKYVASSVGRTEIEVSGAGSAKSVSMTIAASHPLVARYVANGVPPRQISVTIWRLQLRSGLVEQLWAGLITSLSFDKHTASFLIPDRIGEATKIRLPVISAARNCQHVLFDGNCRAARAAFLINTTVASHDGRVVNVASMGGKPDQWARFGELLHAASGERMTISDQTGLVVTMQLPIYEMAGGDAIYVFAGCNRLIDTCFATFNNKDNFGGQPQLPQGGNLWVPNSLGVVHS